MSLWTGIKNLFENLGASKSSYHDDETHVDRASKRKSTLRLFFSRLARISLMKHSEASKDSTHKTYDIDGHGEIRPQPSQRPTDSVIGHNGPLLSNQRPRAPSTVSTISHESIQGIVPQSLEDGIASASASTAPPSLDTLETPDAALDDDEDEPGAAETQKLLDELDSAPARERRRHIIHNLLGAGPALQWMLRHPEDLWDTDEEEEARFAPMRADESVKEDEWQDRHGLNDLREDLPKKEYKKLRKRAKKAGWYLALQETVFRKYWCAEGGTFGKKGSGVPPPEEVGPMGETV